MPDFSQITTAWDQLTVFRDVVGGTIGEAALRLARSLAASQPDPAVAGRMQRELAVMLVEWAESHGGSGDAWQAYLVEQILAGECVFGRQAAVAPLDRIGSSMRAMAAADLARLQCVYELTSESVADCLQSLHPGGDYPSWENGTSDGGAAESADPRSGEPVNQADRQSALHPDGLRLRLHTSREWNSLLEPLAARYFSSGIGPLQGSHAFRWSSTERLVGVANPDPIRLDDLVGYDFQKGLLIRNTEQFLSGYPCNNILLYGARGTGKSSLVKALLNEYSARGLRLVEVARDDMGDFPRIVRHLRGRPQRFLLYADDLSYDDAELNYRELKAALEGSIEGRPDNVLLYATSNRRHLIKERFRDREASDDEIHTHDTAQEKLSLADRFGLTLSFASPTQPEYLRMVDSIARRRGIVLDRDELHAAAIRWAALHNTPSGRTARQFIDDLEGSTMAASPRS